MIRTFLAASVAALAVAGPAMAQEGIPAEFPPESYAANQYVDSEGCAFIRAGIGGMTNWIPRMSRSREPLCGFEPSLAAAAPAAAESRTAATAAPTRSAGASPASRRASAAPVSPRVVTPQPTVARDTPPVLTRAAFCAGRSGPQPGYVSSRTGETIICGEDRDARPGAPLRGTVTLAAVCADMAATGRRYVLKHSGEPVSCSPHDATAPAPGSRLAAAMPALPAGPTGTQACDSRSESRHAGTGASTLPRRCGPQVQSPSGLGNAARLASRGTGVMAFLDPAGDLRRAAAAVPMPDPVSPPRGYRSAWDDGRLNPNRGVRIVEQAGAGQVRAPVTAAPVAVPTALVSRVATRSAPVAPAVAAQGRFVQIGAFAQSANADRAAARLRAMGLPVAHGRVTKGGTEMRIVATGPFADAATLGRVLGTVRQAGYADAFARR